MSGSGSVARMLALAALLLTAGEAAAQRMTLLEAPLRDPQVAIQGTGLRSYLDSVGEHIDPTSGQVDGELLALVVSFTMQVELAFRSEPGSIGLYNGYDAAPVLYEVFPTQALAHWFAVISFRTSPTRVVVDLFDETATYQGQRVYSGGDKNGIGFYLASTQATVYSQDARNPGGAAKTLFFRGTGFNTGDAWLALESSTGPDPDDDFDDAVLWVEMFSGGDTPLVTPVHRVRWGEVKSWYR